MKITIETTKTMSINQRFQFIAALMQLSHLHEVEMRADFLDNYDFTTPLDDWYGKEDFRELCYILAERWLAEDMNLENIARFFSNHTIKLDDEMKLNDEIAEIENWQDKIMFSAIEKD